MNKIKYIFLSAIICIAATTLVFQSCNNESGIPLSDSASKIVISSQYDHLDLPKEYQQIGQSHNEVLDTAFAEVNKALYATTMQARVKSNGNPQYVQKSLKSLDFNNVIKNAILKYAKSNVVLKGHYSDCVKTINNTKMSLVKSSSNSTSISDNLNPTQRILMDSVKSALTSQDPNKSFVGLKEKLNKINKDAAKYLTEREAQCIYSATSVAYNSFQYWHKNMPKWAFMFTSYNLSNDECKEFTKACKVGLRKSVRYKSNDYFELADGSYLLPEVVVYGRSIWNDIVLPTIYADANAAATEAGLAAMKGMYLTEISGGTLAAEAAVGVLGDIALTAGCGSIYEAVRAIYNY